MMKGRQQHWGGHSENDDNNVEHDSDDDNSYDTDIKNYIEENE
jgi:hypothetical protein